MSGGLDPIALQVMVGALRAACDEMGAVLVRSAHSANVKERRDASTAPSPGPITAVSCHSSPKRTLRARRRSAGSAGSTRGSAPGRATATRTVTSSSSASGSS